MTIQQPNGLTSLNAQRERARRAMPPPRHPVAAAEPVAESSSASPAVRPPDPVSPSAAAEGAPQQPRPSPGARSATRPTEPTFKVTLYVDRQTDEFMEATRVEGLTSRPKVDVSRSAVVRLALRRLMDDMSPADVKMLLERQTVRQSGPGRKRR